MQNDIKVMFLENNVGKVDTQHNIFYFNANDKNIEEQVESVLINYINNHNIDFKFYSVVSVLHTAQKIANSYNSSVETFD